MTRKLFDTDISKFKSMNEIVDKRKEIGSYIFISKYAQTKNGKKETWAESVDRVMAMHRDHAEFELGLQGDALESVIKRLSFSRDLYLQQIILGSQRALQYGGPSMLRHHARSYNCSGSYINRLEFFQELMYLLLCGAGCGYSVQKVHTNQLPKVKGVDTSQQKVYVIPDSVEGWSYAVNERVKSHWMGLPEVIFDYSQIRLKGSYISGGFKAPGPEPLKKCLDKMDSVLKKIRGRKATPFELHRLACLIADAVISGGIRRSALLCQFDADDKEMLFCKTGNWFSEFPELARANNSAIILPSTPKEVYEAIFDAIRQFGEPGVIFSKHPDVVYNPCCFVGDTVVAVADGRNGVTIKELAESKESIPIYYKNKRGKVCIEYGRAFCTGEKKVVKVVLSNGSVINCTPDHPLQTVDGNYVAAGESEGVMLSKFFSSKKRKYRTINSFTNGYARQYRMIWEFHNGEKPEGQEIDHIDNSVGDFISNLQLLPLEDHLRKTGDERMGDNNPIHKADKDRMSEIGRAKSFLENNSRYSGLSGEDLIEIGREVIRQGKNLTRKNCQSINSHFPAGFSKNRFGGSWSLYVKYVLGELEYRDPVAPTYVPKETPSLDYLAEPVYVVSVIDEGVIEEVYDIEMECPEHNFAIITKGDSDYGNSEGVFVHNCEVSGYPQIDVDGQTRYGWFFCNLTEINGSKIKTPKEFYEACQAASILGTMQSSYTNFKVLTDTTKRIAERDALIGVGITGMCENPDILFDPSVQRNGATKVREMNEIMARELGINPAARCTVIKPSGNSSQLLGCTSSGIHFFPFRRFIRNIQANNTEQAFQVLKEMNPFMVKPSAYNPDVESVVSFPVELGNQVLTSDESTAIDFLKLVKLTKENWVEEGTNRDHPFYKEHPDFSWMRMNVSNTVTVRENEWNEVRDYVWENRDVFSGISFLPKGGDLLYPQAPYTSVLDETELAERYGAGAILAGGLIIDGLSVFDDNLWLACDVAMGRNNRHLTLTKNDITDFISKHLTDDGRLLVNVNGVMISDVNAISSYLQSIVDKKVDWVRRFKKFANKYLGGDLNKTEYCLKHVSLFHRWQKLRDIKPVNWEAVEWEERLVDISTTAAQGCAGGACELK